MKEEILCYKCGHIKKDHHELDLACPNTSNTSGWDFTDKYEPIRVNFGGGGNGGIGGRLPLRGDSTKFDLGKPMWDLLPFAEIEDVVKVLTYGANKYKKDGWKTVPNGLPRYIAATMRHISSYMTGEDNDTESTLSHLSHACTNILFMMYLEKHKND